MSQSPSNENELFNRCRQLADVREREIVLEQSCGDNVALRDRVQQLLDAYESEPAFLEPQPQPTLDLLPSQLAEVLGTRIGPYELTRILGQGGMGMVYLARQTAPIRRLVAIKIIRPGLESANLALRFEAERQALAVMDHPSIAKVLDAGVTESGRPYFVMEYIDGISITKFCDEQRMTVPDRLRLFQSVCDAVQHAHRKGVIHRDIKPSNILVSLVDGQPLPKVIDFGVAKAIDQKLTSETICTTYGQFVGTLEYMSPEQARHDPAAIDTRTDVYGLGVLLYELLSGVTPFDPRRLREVTFEELLRILCNEEPPSPTQRLMNSELATQVAAVRGAEPVQLRRQLSRELEWIVLKAIEKSPNRRYSTPQDLGDDIRRFLSGQTVVARSPRPMDRAVKIIRRRPAVTALVTVLILATAGFAAGLVLHNARLSAALDVAQGTNYAATIHNAWVAYQNNDFTSFLKLISRYRDESGLEKYRGVEWDFLNHIMPRTGREIANLGYPVYAAIYSPDGRSMAIVGESPRLLIVDAATGAIRLDLQTKQKEINSVTFDPHVPRLWYTGDDGTVHELNYQENQPGLNILAHPGAEAFEVLYDPHRSLLVTCGRESQIRLWNAATGDPHGILDGHTATVQTLHWLADGRRFLSASNDGYVALWDVEKVELIRRFEVSNDRLFDVAVMPDDTLFATCAMDGYVTLFDLKSGAVMDEISFHDIPNRLTFSADGQHLAAIDRQGNLRVYEVAAQRIGKRKLIRTEAWAIETERAFAMDRSPAGHELVTTSKEGQVLVWDNPWAVSSRYVDLDCPENQDFQFDATSRALIVAGKGLRMVDVTTGIASRPIDTDRVIQSVEIAPDNAHFAAADVEGLVTIHALGDLSRIAEHLTTRREMSHGSLSLSRDSRTLIVAEHRQEYVRLLDALTGKVVHLVPAEVSRLALCSPTEDKFVMTDPAKQLSMRTLDSPAQVLWRSSIFQYDVECLKFTPDGQILVVSSGDRVIRCLNARTGELLRELRGNTRAIESLDIAPDGRTIASLDSDGLLKLWHLESGQLLIELRAKTRPPGWPNTCCFSPDGRWLAHTLGHDQVRLLQLQYP